jgi:hypothetical protein
MVLAFSNGVDHLADLLDLVPVVITVIDISILAVMAVLVVIYRRDPKFQWFLWIGMMVACLMTLPTILRDW